MPHIYFDITLNYRRCGRRPNGLIRVERQLAKHFLDHQGGQTRFCRFDRRNACLLAVSRRKARFVLHAGETERGRRNDGVGGLRGALARCRDFLEYIRARYLRLDVRQYTPLRRLVKPRVPPGIGEGAVYVIAGSPWDWHDFEAIADLKRRYGFKLLVMVQDLLPILFPHDYPNRRVTDRFRKYLAAMLPVADRIVCISDAAKKDLLRFIEETGSPRPPVCRTVLGGDIGNRYPPTRPARLSTLRPKGYALSVANPLPRKNVELLYQVWSRLAETHGDGLPPLVVTGDLRWGAGDLLRKLQTDPNTKNSILLPGRVSDGELAWLYENCLFTLYPSLYEGWGLPVSESLAYGKFCLASSTSALPEAGQGCVKHIDPLDFSSWYRETQRLLFDPERLGPLERSIDKRYRPITWRDAGDTLMNHVTAMSSGPSTNANG